MAFDPQPSKFVKRFCFPRRRSLVHLTLPISLRYHTVCQAFFYVNQFLTQNVVKHMRIYDRVCSDNNTVRCNYDWCWHHNSCLRNAFDAQWIVTCQAYSIRKKHIQFVYWQNNACVVKWVGNRICANLLGKLLTTQTCALICVIPYILIPYMRIYKCLL